MEILFVCTGNTCRSPMAEGLMNLAAERENLPIHASSCGLAAISVPASENAVAAAAELGADISRHTARQVTEEQLCRADVVLCMSARHLYALKNAFPKYSDKIFTLSGRDIADPYGGTLDDYRKCAVQIRDAIDSILSALKERLK